MAGLLSRLEYPDDPSMWGSHEANYQVLFVPYRAVFPPGTLRFLRTGLGAAATRLVAGSVEAKTRTW
jgi:hypothetical protein